MQVEKISHQVLFDLDRHLATIVTEIKVSGSEEVRYHAAYGSRHKRLK
jgi:hypothetical protein